MSVILHIKDESTIGKLINELQLSFESDKITVRELIKRRIHEEVAKYNAPDEHTVLHGLVQPEIAEQILNGFKLPKKKAKVDEALQTQIALEAFENNGYFILIDDKQVDELDMMITISPKTSVSFIKLIPLVGG